MTDAALHQMIWHVPNHMRCLANRTVMQFGEDRRGVIAYSFDAMGFRNHVEEICGPAVVVIGNSVSFGLGLEYHKTFGSLTAKKLNRPLINLAFGSYLHDNRDHLANVKNMLSRDCDDIFLIQINNLDRCRRDDQVILDAAGASTRLQQYWQEIEQLLAHRTRLYLYWDHQDHNLPNSITSQWLIRNQLHLDRSIADNPDTFGERSHHTIHRVIADWLVRSW